MPELGGGGKLEDFFSHQQGGGQQDRLTDMSGGKAPDPQPEGQGQEPFFQDFGGFMAYSRSHHRAAYRR